MAVLGGRVEARNPAKILEKAGKKWWVTGQGGNHGGGAKCGYRIS